MLWLHEMKKKLSFSVGSGAGATAHAWVGSQSCQPSALAAPGPFRVLATIEIPDLWDELRSPLRIRHPNCQRGTVDLPR
jgi:hypothetical protein